MLFNWTDILDGAARRIAPAPPATPGERAAIAQRMTAREMFDSFERDLDDFEALKICAGGARG